MYLKKKIDSLIHMADTEDKIIIADCLKSFNEYVTAVNTMEIKLKIAKFRAVDREDFVDIVQALDRNRHHKHNSAIISVKMLNRIAKSYNSEDIYEGDLESRYEIADFAMEVVKSIYENRIM